MRYLWFLSCGIKHVDLNLNAKALLGGGVPQVSNNPKNKLIILAPTNEASHH